MDIRDFYLFGSKLVSSNFQAIPIELKKNENGVSYSWNLVKGEFKGVSFPIRFMQDKDMGKKMMDILDTGWPSLFLISERMKNILEEYHLTGWITYPIKLYNKDGNEISGYYGFSIIGQCGPINYEKSEIIEKRYVPQGPVCKFYKGLNIGLDQWDNTDFFTPFQKYEIVITKRAADILNKHKITNMRLTNLAEYEIDLSLTRKRT